MSKLRVKTLSHSDLLGKVGVVVGTRPGIVMFSPIIRELERQKINFFIIHTGQHYSYNMDRKFFEDLELKEPTYKFNNLKRYKLHGEQTAVMLKKCEEVLVKERPKILLVGGDANCNLAGALAARKLHIMVGHVEAGERSYDWRMPEEHNRRIIDHISEYLFATNNKSKKTLQGEKILGKIFVTGNPIVDAALQNRKIAFKKSDVLKRWELKKKQYFLLTTHREENVDSPVNLKNILSALSVISERYKTPLIFLAHPRTQKRIKQFDLNKLIKSSKYLILKDAVGYLDFINLLSNSRLVFTDSGGVQQEACIFKIPCVTLRDNTEWIETIKLKVNILAGTNPEKIVSATDKMLKKDKINIKIPFGNGNAAKNIVKILKKELGL